MSHDDIQQHRIQEHVDQNVRRQVPHQGNYDQNFVQDQLSIAPDPRIGQFEALVKVLDQYDKTLRDDGTLGHTEVHEMFRVSRKILGKPTFVNETRTISFTLTDYTLPPGADPDEVDSYNFVVTDKQGNVIEIDEYSIEVS